MADNDDGDRVKQSKSIEVKKDICDIKELEGYTSVTFPAKITFTDPHKQLPDSIEEIIFHAYFDTPLLVPSIFPKHLKILDLGWYFNQEVTDDMLPESLEELVFGYWF